MTQSPSRTESDLRTDLGIPIAATRVLVMCESTHWDPNWMLTSKEYYRLFVRRSLDRAIDELLDEPRRIFSLESVFFPDMYWRDRPQRRDVFRELVNRGQLRFSGCGVTTPDTLLPADEMLLRDLLIGQEWIRERGMTTEPDVLYLPDSFGHSPGLPSILCAAGINGVAFHRIDGMHFSGGETDPRSTFPRVGSSAEVLQRESTSDFIWRSADGSEVLAHWLEHGYGHGDMIASRGFTRTLQLPLSWSSRNPRRVAHRIRAYIDRLSPTARTPYLLLALGHDFVTPIPNLIELIDDWNERHFDSTGVWLVNTAMETYFSLVSHHRDALPVLEFDPNPCWTGFYSSRPTLKAAARRLHGSLIVADHAHTEVGLLGEVHSRGIVSGDVADHPRDEATGEDPTTSPLEAWWIGALSNHHDFITGTANDRVALGEQMDLLQHANQLLTPGPGASSAEPTGRQSRTSDAHAPDEPPRPTPATSGADRTWRRDRTSSRPGQRTGTEDSDRAGTSHRSDAWSRAGTRTTIHLDWATAIFDEAQGGALVSLVDQLGNELITGPAFGLHSHRDSGGLWRMGCEFRGGHWFESDTSIMNGAHVSVHSIEGQPNVAVTIDTMLERRPAAVRAILSVTEPVIIVESITAVPNRRTVTLTLPGADPIECLEMHQPGGLVLRPTMRCYEPTFWPLHSFAHVLSDNSSSESPHARLSIAVPTPTGIHADPTGVVAVIVARTAVKELAHGFRPILAPVWGRRWGAQHSMVAFGWSPSAARLAGGEWELDDQDDLGSTSIPGPQDAPQLPPGVALHDAVMARAGVIRPRWLATSDDPMVETIAVKPADRGGGTIIRLRNWAYSSERTTDRTMTVSIDPSLGATISSAWLTDARERDLTPLTVTEGAAHLSMSSHLATIRVRCRPTATGGDPEHGSRMALL